MPRGWFFGVTTHLFSARAPVCLHHVVGVIFTFFVILICVHPYSSFLFFLFFFMFLAFQELQNKINIYAQIKLKNNEIKTLNKSVLALSRRLLRIDAWLYYSLASLKKCSRTDVNKLIIRSPLFHIKPSYWTFLYLLFRSYQQAL